MRLQKLSPLVILAGAFALGGCIPTPGGDGGGIGGGSGGGGGSGASGGYGNYSGNNNAGNNAPQVNLTGYTVSPGSVANGGTFQLGWSAQQPIYDDDMWGMTTSYTATHYLLPAGSTNVANGVQIHSGNHTASATANAPSVSCSYSAAMTVSCGGGAAVDVSGLLTQGSTTAVTALVQYQANGASVGQSSASLTLPAAAVSGGSYSDPAGDATHTATAANVAYLDITGATTAPITATSDPVKASLTVAGGLNSLTYDQGVVATGDAEYVWRAQYDVGVIGDATDDIALVVAHRESGNAQANGDIVNSGAFSAELWHYAAGGQYTDEAGNAYDVVGAAAATFAKDANLANTLVVQMAQANLPAGVTVTGTTPVRFVAWQQTGAGASAQDNQPDRVGGVAGYN